MYGLERTVELFLNYLHKNLTITLIKSDYDKINKCDTNLLVIF